jgi:uncharacterized protein
LITAAELKSRTVKDLAALARKKQVLGWHAMKKDELVQALVKAAKAEEKCANSANSSSRRGRQIVKPQAGHNGKAGNHAPMNGKRPQTAEESAEKGEKKHSAPRLQDRLDEIKAKLAEAKDLSFRCVTGQNGQAKDRLVVMVRDPYWLHAYWELGRRSVERAQAALGQNWHGARPVLRLHEVSRNGTTSSARQAVRDIEIHGGVNNWYIDVQNPPKSYQLEIGYLAPGGRFFCLARSNVVSTPRAGSAETFDHNWAEVAKDFDRVYAMSGGYVEPEANDELKEVFEEQLHRPIGEPLSLQFGVGATAGTPRREFNFHIDTELIVHGVTQPDARVTLRGEPVHLRADGTFAVRFSLPDRRHVLPVVASSSDGVEQRTIVLAVDRNTKVMEPVIRDHSE